MSAAIFMDRDGTLIKDKDYLSDPGEVEWFPGVFRALKNLRDFGFELIIVTNQSGVARGYFDEETVQGVNDRIRKDLTREGIEITDIYYCPSHPEAEVEKYRRNLHLRKPAPGMLEKAVVEHELDTSGSYMVGDKLSDVECGARIGCTTVLVKTGKNIDVEKESQFPEQNPDHIAPDFSAAAGWILNSTE